MELPLGDPPLWHHTLASLRQLSEQKNSPVSHCTLQVPTEKRSGVTPPIELNGYLINVWIQIIFSSIMILIKCCVLVSSLELSDHCIFPIFLAFLFEISQRFFHKFCFVSVAFCFRLSESHRIVSCRVEVEETANLVDNVVGVSHFQFNWKKKKARKKTRKRRYKQSIRSKLNPCGL